jgi:hypothetical protein
MAEVLEIPAARIDRAAAVARFLRAAPEMADDAEVGSRAGS